MTRKRNRDEGATPGPVVRINGRNRSTIMDESGVQRFPQNRIICLLLDYADFKSGAVGFNDPGPADLAAIHARTARGEFSEDERRELYRLIGYSVCGYSDCFPDDSIENPLWEKDDGS